MTSTATGTSAGTTKPAVWLTVLGVVGVLLVMIPPHMSDLRDDQGHRAYSDKRYDDAVDRYTRAIWWSWLGASAGLYCERGDANDMAGNLEAALADYDEAIRRSPNTARFHYERGIALARAGRHAEAVETYDKAIALTDTKSQYYLRRAVSRCELKAWGPARDDLDRYERLATSIEKGVLDLARGGVAAVKATAAGQTPAAVPRTPVMASGQHLAFETRARALEGLGDVEGAGEAWCAAVWTDPSCAAARRGLAGTPFARTHALPAAWAP